MPADRPGPSPWSAVLVTVALLTVVVSAVLTAFAWPAARTTVHDVPIVVAGPGPAAAQVTAALQERLPGAFEITRVSDTAAAEQAVRDRDAYGAIDVSQGPPQVITASAAGPVVAQTLQGVATALAAGGATPVVAVRDIVPLPGDDPRGAGLAAGALPLVIGGLLAALLLSTRIRGMTRRVTGALAFAVTGGLAIAAILQFGLGSITGPYLLNAAGVGLSVAAVALTLLGLESLLGTLGFGLGAATMMLVGNPLSGLASAPPMLPGRSGELGQLLPPGAAGTLLRSTAFFDGHGAARPVLVLLVWFAAGAGLCAAAGLRNRRRPAAAETPQARPQAAALA